MYQFLPFLVLDFASWLEMFLQVVDELTRVFGQYFNDIYIFYIYISDPVEIYAGVRCKEWIKFYLLQNMF